MLEERKKKKSLTKNDQEINGEATDQKAANPDVISSSSKSSDQKNKSDFSEFEQKSDKSDFVPIEVTNIFSENEINEFLRQFRIYKNKKKTMTTNLIKILVRSLGYNPTNDYLEQRISELDPTGKVELDEKNFLKLLAGVQANSVTDEEALEAFKNLDPNNKGFISAKDLNRYMTLQGERLEKFEVIELLTQGDTKVNGRILYADLVKRLKACNGMVQIDSRRDNLWKLKLAFNKKVRQKKKSQGALAAEDSTDSGI